MPKPVSRSHIVPVYNFKRPYRRLPQQLPARHPWELAQPSSRKARPPRFPSIFDHVSVLGSCADPGRGVRITPKERGPGRPANQSRGEDIETSIAGFIHAGRTNGRDDLGPVITVNYHFKGGSLGFSSSSLTGSRSKKFSADFTAVGSISVVLLMIATNRILDSRSAAVV